MNYLITQQLLFKAAYRYVKQRQNYSKEEIVSKINEIKYLAAQKKVPKLTLRKEIIHLENKLQRIFDIEKKMVAEEKRESAKVVALKEQITVLKKRLASTEDKDMQKKVDKLSHLLAECIATEMVAKDIALTNNVMAEEKSKESMTIKPLQKPLMMAKVHALESRLTILKQMLPEKEEDNPDIIKAVEAKIEFIEQKLKEYTQSPQNLRVKHTMMFHTPPPQKKIA